MCRGKSPLLLNWTHIGAESALFKGAICERAEILGAVLAPINFKVAPAVFKFTLHVVQFGPYNGVDSAPKLVPKTAPFQWGRIDPRPVPGLTRFGPIFGAKSALLILQCMCHLETKKLLSSEKRQLIYKEV